MIQLRRDEQDAAAKLLGVSSVTYFDFEDGVVECTPELKREIAREIRRLKPDTVVMNDPAFLYEEDFGIINHTDHRKVAEAAMDAVYPLARDHLSFPELMAEGFAPHKVKEVLITKFGQGGNFFVDIDEVFETKMAALAEHASQVDVKMARGWVETGARRHGREAGLERAESYTRISLFI